MELHRLRVLADLHRHGVHHSEHPRRYRPEAVIPMGYVKHQAVIVTIELFDAATDLRIDRLKATLRTIRDELDPVAADPTQLIAGPIHSLINSTVSYILAPDGSREGWLTSILGDACREAFANHFHTYAKRPAVVEVSYGGDYGAEIGATAAVLAEHLAEHLAETPE